MTMPTDEHDHGPTARLLDPVWCLTCDYQHVATIPVVTFRCHACGFGCWGASVAAAHAESYTRHIVYPAHHQIIPLEETNRKARP